MANDTQKHTLHLRTGDWDWIESVYKHQGVSTSLVIRSLVSKFVDSKKAELNDSPANLNSLDIEL